MNLRDPIFLKVPDDSPRVAGDEFVSRPGGGSGVGAGGRSLSDRAYLHLRDQIISGPLHGGTVISEAAVAKTLGMSRTPVSDAIRQLVREGLLDQVPRFGTVVRELDRAELVELYEVREALESYAAGKLALRGEPNAIARVEQLCAVIEGLARAAAARGADVLDAQTIRQFLAADMGFHLTIVQAAGNKRITDCVVLSRSISRIFKKRAVQDSLESLTDAAAAHRRIADAIRGGDARAATEGMFAHIRVSKARALECFDNDRSRGRVTCVELPPEIQEELDRVERGITSHPGHEATAAT